MNRAASSKTAGIWIWLFAVLLIGALLRFADLGEQGFRSDEIHVISRSAGSLSGLPGRIADVAGAAPLEFLVQRAVLFFSVDEFVQRLPGAIFGGLAICVTFSLACRLFGPVTGVVAALLLALSGFHLFHSQNARLYSLFTVLAAGSTLALVGALARDRWRNWAGYSLLLTLSFYASYLTALVAVAHAVYVLLPRVFPKREREGAATGFILSALAAVAAFVPWAVYGEAPPLGSPSTHHLLEAAPGVLENFASGGGAATPVYGALFAIGLAFAVHAKRSAAALCALLILSPLPYLAAIDSSPNTVQVSDQVIFALPFFLSLVAFGLVEGSERLARRLAGWNRRGAIRWGAMAAITALLVLFAGTAIPAYRASRHEAWREAARYVTDRTGRGDVVVPAFPPSGAIERESIRFYLEYPGGEIRRYRVLDAASLEAERLDRLLATSRVWFVTGGPAYLAHEAPAIIDAVVNRSDEVARFRGRSTDRAPIAIYASRPPLVFLIDQPAERTSAGAAARRATACDGIHRDSVTRPFASPVSRKVTLGDHIKGETRHALCGRPPSAYTFRLPGKREGNLLEFAIGVTYADPNDAADVRFRVLLGDNADPIFETTLSKPPDRKDTGWHPFSVPLSPGGEEGTLTLETSIVDERKGSGGSAAWWGNPRLRPAEGVAAAPVILISIDTLRADHLSIYDYPRDTSPVIDAFARDAVLFRNNFSQAPWTPPSFASILTSAYASAHRTGRSFLLDAFAPGLNFKFWEKFNPKHATLPEVLRAHGYRTLSLSNNIYLSNLLGFETVFDRTAWMVYPAFKADDFAKEAILWLRQYAGESFFLLLNFMDPHGPIGAPPRFRELFSQDDGVRNWSEVLDGYDADIAFADNQVGVVLDALKALGLYDRSLIVLLSDHGQELGERGRFGHGHSRFDEMIHTPLLIKFPNQKYAGRVVDHLVRNLDIAPTILDYAGLPNPEGTRGSTLLTLLDASRDQPQDARVAFAESEHPWTAEEKVSVRTARHKLIYNVVTGQEMLFDVEKDPFELEDLSEYEPAFAARLRALLLTFLVDKFPGIYLVCASPQPVTVTGSIQSEGAPVRRTRLFFHEPNDSVSVQGKHRVEFTFEVSQDLDALLIDPPAFGRGMRIDLKADGEPMATGNIALGWPPRPPSQNPWRIADASSYGLSDYASASEGVLEMSTQAARCYVWSRDPLWLQRRSPAPPAAPAKPIDPDLREKLRALGYAD